MTTLYTNILLAVLGTAWIGQPALSAEIWWPGKDFPPADRASTPDWLTTQKICFSRWDGGRIEACKGFLSGWTFFNPPWPDVIHATCNWYEPSTVELASQMGYNFLWVTFSAGFSNELERGQWEQLREYVSECHQKNIRVAAYMSSTNLFVDDMLEHVPQSKEWLLIGDDGQPLPYGAANYQSMGRVTRMLADISHPGWIAYQKQRIDAAIELGFDAIEYDNVTYVIGGSQRSQDRYRRFLKKNAFADSAATRAMFQEEQSRRFFRELLAHARERKPDMVIFHNDNYPHYAVAQSDSIISTEDGKEPGYYHIEAYAHEISDKDTVPPRYADLLDADEQGPFDPDRLVTNLALLRLLKSLDQGWKPVLVEFGGRRHGQRMLNQMPPLALQLSVAECNAALCSYQGYQEGRALLDLFLRKPEVMPIIEAAGQVHQFVKQHAQHVLGARYKADVAVVVDDRMRGRDLLKRLARQNVQFEVLLEDRIQDDYLRRFQRVLVYDAALISDRAIEALRAYAQAGGRLMVQGNSGQMDLWGQPRADNPLSQGDLWEVCDENGSAEQLVDFLTTGVARALDVLNCPYVLFTLTEHPHETQFRFVAHLLNYAKTPRENVRLRCPGATNLTILSLTPGCDQILRGEQPDEWVIPRLGLYSLVLVQ